MVLISSVFVLFANYQEKNEDIPAINRVNPFDTLVQLYYTSEGQLSEEKKKKIIVKK